MWFNPKSNLFLVWIILLFLVAIACFRSGATSNGFICAVFGAVGLKMYIKAKKK